MATGRSQLLVQYCIISNHLSFLGSKEEGIYSFWFLGPGLAKKIKDMIDCCFNMDGAKPPGRKVGLIDEYHIWCFLMNPFNYEWRITFTIDGNMI